MRLQSSLASLSFVLAVVQAENAFFSPRNPGAGLFARAVCGFGDTCAEACGTGWETCIEDPWCYNPSVGDICCPNAGYCKRGNYCVYGVGIGSDWFCCPDGQEASVCASSQGTTLPTGYSVFTGGSATVAAATTTATSTASTLASAGLTTAGPSSTGRNGTSPVLTMTATATVAQFTGAANAPAEWGAFAAAAAGLAGVMGAL